MAETKTHNEQPVFDIDDEITSPQLKRIGSLVECQMVMAMLASDARSYLAQGVIPGPIKIENGGELGQLLAHALIHRVIGDAKNIALLYVFSHKEEKNILADLAATLNLEGHLELFRPGVMLLKDACQEQWTNTYDARKKMLEDAKFAGDTEIFQIAQQEDLSDISEWSSQARKSIELAPRDFVAGAAWSNLNQNIIIALKDKRNPENKIHLADLMGMVLDVVKTIPNVRPMAAYAVAGAIECVHRYQDAWGEEAATKAIVELSSYLNKDEAGAVMRQLAQKIAINQVTTPTKKNMEQLAQALIGQNPENTLNEWLVGGDTDERLNDENSYELKKLVSFNKEWDEAQDDFFNTQLDWDNFHQEICRSTNWIAEQVGVDHNSFIDPDVDKKIQDVLQKIQDWVRFPLLEVLHDVQSLAKSSGLKNNEERKPEGQNEQPRPRRSKL